MQPNAFIRNLTRIWSLRALSLIASGSKSGFFHTRYYIGDSKRKAIFCEYDGSLAGILTYDRKGRGCRRQFCIDLISVEPDFQRKGLGTAMMTLACKAAVRANCAAISSEVKATNIPSLALMRAHGFAEEEPDELNVVKFLKDMRTVSENPKT